MNKHLLLCLSLLMVGMLNAQTQLNDGEAFKIASGFADTHLNAKGEPLSLVSSDGVYIYNVGNHGFVIVSGNTVLPPILGYSTQAAFPGLEDAPDNLAAWIGHYNDMIDYALAEGIQAKPGVRQQWEDAFDGRFPTKNATTVNPLVTTYWNQDCYYNEYCPSTWGGGPCGHVYAGCVACAMAQVMKYWSHPAQGFGSHSYIHGTYGEQSANFAATTYHWDQMPSQIYSHNDAVATLMYHCGVSVDMNYSASGSGAQSADVETALRSYFGYCGAKYRSKSSYTNEMWVEMLKSELDLSHPIYYSGSNGSSGHAFVCDGYDGNDYFHFNFGWSGYGDAYYAIDDIYGFNSAQAAVMNIVPMDISADDNGIIYVSADGTGNGSSWDAATPLLEYATFLSSGGNTKVWVKHGTYYGDDTDPINAFTITASNKVYGGFNGDEGPDFDLADRDIEANATILDGQGFKRVLNQADFFSSGSRAVWDGFIIQNGNSGSGGGVYLNDYTTLSNCVIRDNTTNGFGGGIYINSSTGTSQTYVTNCVITGNTASMGGGICDRNSSVITNCVISGNTALTKGGGVYLYNTDKPVLRGCIVSNNTAVNGGGLYARGKCQLSNCDIVMNLASEGYGGLYTENRQSTFYSCILWGNEANGAPNQTQGVGIFGYCAVQGGIEGEGNIDLPAENDGDEPGVFVRFVSPAAGTGADFTEADWDIDSRSICLNAGKSGTPGYSIDIAGNQRVQHGRVDIGAYEHDASLTLITDRIPEGGSYLFNGRELTELGYYTTVYPMPDCDSVVGLTLVESTWGVDDIHEEPFHGTSLRVYDMTGRYVGDDIRKLAPGIYVIREANGIETRTKKILVR